MSAAAQDWDSALSTHIGARIAAVRALRNLSAQKLADATAALGHEVPRGAIARVETGKRHVSVAELIVLALALEVAPWALLANVGSDEHVPAAPQETVSSAAFIDWWCGVAGSGDGIADLVAHMRAVISLRERFEQALSGLGVPPVGSAS